MKKISFGCIVAAASLLALAGCEQDKVVYRGADYLMFSDTLYRYGVQENNEIFNVPVSATVPADYDRTFAVEILDKKSNAIEGKHYRLLSNTVTVKAGEMVANVEVQGNYESFESVDSLGFVLHLIVPEANEWKLYGTEAKVLLQKVCPFDISSFTGYCTVTSTFFMSEFVTNTTKRLITSGIVEGKENTVVLHNMFYDGYNVEISFDRKDVMKPYVGMKEQACATTSEVIGSIFGNGKVVMYQPTNYVSYYSPCENFVFQYITMIVRNKDGSIYGGLGTYVNIIEWISEAEAEKLKEQGY